MCKTLAASNMIGRRTRSSTTRAYRGSAVFPKQSVATPFSHHLSLLLPQHLYTSLCLWIDDLSFYLSGL